jgi:hypothetical protein
MPAPDHIKRGKLHLAAIMLVSGVVIIGAPYLLAWRGVIPALKPNAWAVLVISYVGIVLKGFIGYLTAKHFRHDKSAYDLSALVMGGVLTCLALQFTSVQDLFPGIESISFFRFMSSFGISVPNQHLAFLGLFFVIALIATMISAVGMSDTEDGKPQALWTLGASGLSFALLGTYALVLITKG